MSLTRKPKWFTRRGRRDFRKSTMAVGSGTNLKETGCPVWEANRHVTLVGVPLLSGEILIG